MRVDGGLTDLWDVRSGTLQARLQGHGQAVRHCAYSPDGRQLAVASGAVAVGGRAAVPRLGA